MGMVYYNQYRLADAQEHYHSAIVRDLYHAKDYFNLANVADELDLPLEEYAGSQDPQ